MYGSEIISILKKDAKTQKYFLNVFANDQLPLTKIQRDSWLLVCNCCPVNMPGLHWIAIFKKDADTIEVFDSYGQSPGTYNLEPFLKSQEVKQSIYNTTRLQALSSEVCGHYCLFYAYWRCRGVSFKTILNGNWFSSDYVENDKFVNNFYEVMIK